MSAAARIPEHNTTVLIVDDDTRNRARLRRKLVKAGYQVFTAADAPTALRLIHKEGCDLVLIGMELPGVDGLALCRLLRAQPGTSKLPIIALSNGDRESRESEAFAAGADDYVARPVGPEEVVSRVALHLRAAEREWALIGSNRELRFLAELGRGLLRALEPEQLMRHVAGATYEGTEGTLCAAYVKLEGEREAGCVFDREGSAEDISLLKIERLRSWLASPAPVGSLLIKDPGEFFLLDELHQVEYAAPLRFGGRTKGALIVAFDRGEHCGETECRLIDAAAQQSALAAHISSLYQAARDVSASLAREVDRRTTEAEDQRRFTEAIIDSLPLSLYAIDRNYRVVAWNRNRELGELGIPRGSVLGKNIFEVLTRQRRDVLEIEFARVFETGEIERIEQETTTATGENKHWLISKIPMWIANSDEVSHVIAVGEDISARVEANRAVARADKLSAIGRLAAGVVHEINNPLATISACAEALESRIQEGGFAGSVALEDLREYLGLIRSEAFRCKTITNGLLDFSRTRAGQHVPLILADVVASAARLLIHQQHDPYIEFRIHTPDDLPLVSGDAGQLQQAIIALATNAMDAMPIGGGRGTGLGLAVCYGILTEHGGSLDVQSTLGVGTTFTITLPAIEEVGDVTV